MNSDQWTVVSKNLATDAGFGISGYDQLHNKKASSLGRGPFTVHPDMLSAAATQAAAYLLNRHAIDRSGGENL
jgi:hypothetical protein